MATAAILLGGWLGWLVPAGSSGLKLTWLEALWPNLPLLGVLALFGALALLLSLLLLASRTGSMLTGALLVGSYLMLGLANINDSLAPIAKLNPLHYYQGGYAVTGVHWGWLGGLLGVALVLALVAWGLFQRRDIRVSGEHGWRLPGLLGRRKVRGTAASGR